MPRRSSILTLPAEVRGWLEQVLIAGNFSGYQELEGLLLEKGYALSKSALHRYGQPLQRRLAAIKASTEAARMLTEGASDDQDARSEAVIALVQTELFETLVNLQEATDESVDPEARVKLLGSAAKNIAALSRASVNLKKYQSDLKERTRAVAESVKDLGERAQLSAEVLAEITERIYGIAA